MKTEWVDGALFVPGSIGLYERIYFGSLMVSYWDGKVWMTCNQYFNEESAFQAIPWRGFTEKA